LRANSRTSTVARLLLIAVLALGVAAPPWAALSALAHAFSDAFAGHDGAASASPTGESEAATGPFRSDQHTHDDQMASDHLLEAMIPAAGHVPARQALRKSRPWQLGEVLPPSRIAGIERPPRRPDVGRVAGILEDLPVNPRTAPTS
jgi:hypothetical protein